MIIAVTNRHLCQGDFIEQIEKIARAKPHALLLREKDLPEAQYLELALTCNEICGKYDVPLIAHRFIDAARKLGIKRIHLPGDEFLAHRGKLREFAQIGVSVHSVDEAVFTASHGASYLIAGHIFSTDCKQGVPPRGLPFLAQVCAAVEIPVFAIGGISQRNAGSVIQNGAAGFCVMSPLMNCDQPGCKIAAYRKFQQAGYI